MTIGDFSRATRLSAKTLRFYHQVGILQPASIDPTNDYRRYDVRQIADAQVIRQLRALSIPVDMIRQILSAEVAVRNELITAHLRRMETELDATRAAVEALRSLLELPSDVMIEYRSIPPVQVLAIRQVIDLPDLSEWYEGAVAELGASSYLGGHRSSGPRGGLWDTGLFLEGRGEAVLFQPVEMSEDIEPPGRTRLEILPAGDVAVAVHRGPDTTMAQTYGALATHVTTHELGIDGPIRESYLQEAADDSDDLVTEVMWPIFRTAR